MKLVFLGTRGYIEARTRRHRRHTSLRVQYRGRSVMVDCGEDWASEIQKLAPRAIVLTHGHPDHMGALKEGSPCTVYATEQTWKNLDEQHCAIDGREVIKPQEPRRIEGIGFEAFTIEHSVRCPAVGYRITAGRVTVFYCPDVVYIHQREAALRAARLYIGDGATIARSLVRRRGDNLIGHTPVRTQLTWCEKEGVGEAIITHCGNEIVGGDERKLAAEISRLARARGIRARIAHDAMEVVLR